VDNKTGEMVEKFIYDNDKDEKWILLGGK